MPTPADLSVLPGARVLQPGRGELRAVTVNSREAQPGDLFFALVGERDGHDFLAPALQAGVGGVVVERAGSLTGLDTEGVLVVEVPDTLRALHDLARVVRRGPDGADVDAVAVTGSVGKTTTKTMLTAALATRPLVVSSPKSFNNHIGVPLTVLGIGAGTTDLVAEIGTNHPGEIAALVELVEPRIGVVTNVGFAHVGNFGTREALADEKASLLRGVRDDGLWVVNADDPLLLAAVARLDRPVGTRVVRVGLADDADVRIGDVVVGEQGTSASVHVDGAVHRVEVPLAGRHFATSAATALFVGLERGLAPDAVLASLRDLPALDGRGAVSRVRDGRVRVVDDSYNGSPDSTLAALATLELLPEPRRIAVLGEMLELGEWSQRLHATVGERVARAATDLVFVGPSYPLVAQAAAAAGMPPDRMVRAASATAAAGVVADLLEQDPAEGAAVQLKASRFVHLERVALRLGGTEVGCRLEICPLYIHCRDCPKLTTG